MSTSPIPTIDVSSLFAGPSPARTEVDQAIGHALQTYQSFMAIGLPDDLRPDAVKMKQLFALFQQSDDVLIPMGTVRVNPNSDRTYRGYSLYGRGNRQYDVGPEPTVAGPAIKDIERLVEPNVFPPEGAMPGWREAMLNYFRSMENFSKLVVGALARFLEVSEASAVARYDQSNSTLRIIEYPTMPGDSATTEIGGQHTDNCGISLLWQDAPGLQMRAPDGQWHDIADRPEGISVHMGEALETQSNGRLHATPHRVMSHGVERHSIAFFLEPGLFASVKPFSLSDHETPCAPEDSYAASLIETLRKTGRA
ncbi:MAG: 2OG-Fe(II) oxygenase family protein [Chloroflexota bacterium]